jgi:hypothetical protein
MSRLGDTAVVWVTGRTVLEGLPAMSPAGWFVLLRVVLGLGDTAVVGVAGRTLSEGLPAMSPVGGLSFGGWCRVWVTRLLLGYGPNVVGGSARHVTGGVGCPSAGYVASG